MQSSRPRLAKGLSALIGTMEPPPQAAPNRESSPGEGMRQLTLDSIEPGPRQPRHTFDNVSLEGLAESIRNSGVLQPIVVRQLAEGRFELIAGERRWRAAKMAGIERIPAIVRQVSDAQSLELALIENLQREDLNPIDRAAGYRQYVETFGISIDELARRLGESRANVSNYIRLLALPDEIRQMVETGQLAMGQARAIAGIADAYRQLALARLAIRRNLAVRQVEALAKAEPRSSEPTSERPAGDVRHTSDIEQSLSRALGLSVGLIPGKKKNTGRVVIQYRTLEEFDLIAEKLGGQKLME
jgi:ParB family transcriptional regulator, chromosome partitioning protein